MNYELRKIENVTISQIEIDFLNAIENPKDRKLLFISLILSKALKKRNTRKNKTILKTSTNYYIHYYNFSDIIRLSRIKNISETDLADIFYKYKNNFTFYSPEKELIKIEFADKNSNNGIVIDNLDNLLEYYEVFFGKNKSTTPCALCGREIIKNNNKQKYCNNCSKIKSREQHKHLMQKRRAI